MRSYPVKENHIGLVVSEILWYTQTDTHILYYKDWKLSIYLAILFLTIYLSSYKLSIYLSIIYL